MEDDPAHNINFGLKCIKGKRSKRGKRGNEETKKMEALSVADDSVLEKKDNEEAEGNTRNSGKRIETEVLALPVEEGRTVLCMWKDGVYRPAKVLHSRKLPTGYEYYVHYTEFNRRLDEWVKPQQMELDYTGPPVVNTPDVKSRGMVMTRRQKRKMGTTNEEEEHEGLDPDSLREHEELTKVKNITSIELGKFEIDTWYFSPFPPEYEDCHKLYFCEFCLTFLKRKEQLIRHSRKCALRHPPGNEIYRSGALSMFEVDGTKNRIYGENLCYLAKLFLDHKSLLCDVEAFLFYILCEFDDRGFHLVAYFSKEKESEAGNNLACILTFPPYQKKGYGNFLIAF